jgi:hypothetical protein
MWNVVLDAGRGTVVPGAEVSLAPDVVPGTLPG